MQATLAPLQLGIPGGMELLVILLIVILLFGASKIPELARSTGQAMGEFIMTALVSYRRSSPTGVAIGGKQ